MSKYETPMIHAFWEKTGGTLVVEFKMTDRISGVQGMRLADAVIIRNGPKEVRKAKDVSLVGQDIICIQAKNEPLSMTLMGQCRYSEMLLQAQEFSPRSTRNVALCIRQDAALAPLAAADDIDVVVIPPAVN